jgi:hypothetical protein
VVRICQIHKRQRLVYIMVFVNHRYYLHNIFATNMKGDPPTKVYILYHVVLYYTCTLICCSVFIYVHTTHNYIIFYIIYWCIYRYIIKTTMLLVILVIIIILIIIITIIIIIIIIILIFWCRYKYIYTYFDIYYINYTYLNIN